MTSNSVDLFTMEEHAIIADWLSVELRCDAEVLETLDEHPAVLK